MVFQKGNKVRLGKKLSEETKKKISRMTKGRIPWNKGKTNCYSEETLRKERESHLGKRHTLESRKKMSEARKGKNNPMYGVHRLAEAHHNWKGGKWYRDGYVWVYVGRRKYRPEHCLIVEKVLGRSLKEDEKVHHINGKKDDNRKSNLLVCGNGYHHSLHLRMSDLYMKEHFPN